MIVLIEILVVLGIGSINQIVFLFRVFTRTTIIEAISTESVVICIFTTIGILAGKVHVEANVFKTMNLIVNLEVS